MKKLFIGLIILNTCLIVIASDKILDSEYKNYWENADNERDFSNFQKTLDKVIFECEKMDKTTNVETRNKYGYWAADIINRSLSLSTLNKEQIDYCRQKLNILLNKSDLFSSNVNSLLLGLMVTLSNNRYLSKDIPEAEWTVLRKNSTEKFCIELNRIEKEIDSKWEEGKIMPVLNVPLPSDVDGVSGMSPSDIKDPIKRKEYEKAIAENNNKIEINNKQSDIRKAKKIIERGFINYTTRVYQKKPYNTDELKELLNKYNINKEIQEKILGKIDK